MRADEFAKRLRQAQNSKTPISPLRNEIGIDNIELAYQIQQVNTKYQLEQGARIIGKKIGLTNKAVQAQLGVDQPDFGMLFNHMEVLNGNSIAASEILHPKIETEIAFVLGEDLDVPNMTIIDMIAAIDYALPSLEIVGSRITNWDIKFVDTVADNASASHFVLGHTPRTLDEFDMVACRMQLHKNNELVSEGSGAGCLGSPLNAMLWLANKMLELGAPLQAGELILTGSLGPMVPIQAGDKITTSVEGLGHVSVEIN